MDTDDDRPFLERHEFLIRRLHSLTGLVPVGAYMVVHLLVNLTVWDRIGGPGMYQRLCYQIHGLGGLLWTVEWLFIFIPILFHGIIGLVIIRGGLSNTGTYPYAANIRYSLQRITGIIAFVFIVYHVFHMHGWFHFDAWVAGVVEPLGGGKFRPYNAASSLALAMRGFWVPALYFVGLAASVFHLANGMWTMGITWGVWTSRSAQRGALYVCGAVGLGVAAVASGAFIGALTVEPRYALEVERRMYEHRVASGEIDPVRGQYKRWRDEEAAMRQVTAE